MLTRTLSKFVLAAVVVAVAADVALAGGLPGPLEFSFFLPGLTELFLLPFSIAGCG